MLHASFCTSLFSHNGGRITKIKPEDAVPLGFSNLRSYSNFEKGVMKARWWERKQGGGQGEVECLLINRELEALCGREGHTQLFYHRAGNQ